jgi:CubicO group peptidase (beta-lactamase class C family)
VSRHTAFPVGSISKAVTATLAMILVGDGDLELDAPIAEHLPELDDLGSQLTLCHLLSHTSGLPSSPDTPEVPFLSSRRYVRNHCRRQDLILPPGTAFSYSNRNYVLVGHLIETITGMNWSEAVESILLRPLDIDSAMVGMAGRACFDRPIATGHSVNMNSGRTRPVHQPVVPAEAPAVALAMSAVDLVALGLMHIGSGFPELLPPVPAEQMRQAIPGVEPFGLADGWAAGFAVWQRETSAWVGHDGNANGTSCYLRIDPVNDYVVALTTNSNTGSALWDELCAKFGLADPQQGRPQWNASLRSVAPPAEVMGSYSNGPTDYLITAADGGDLFLEIGGEPIARLAFYEDLNFLMQDPASGQGRHVGRFLRDPITRQVDYLQIGGRLAPRRPLDVPEARTPSESVSRVSA